MTVEEFLEEFQDLLQRDDPVSLDSVLKELEEWDSMSVMACMVWLDKRFDQKYSYAEIGQLATVQDILTLTKGAVA